MSSTHTALTTTYSPAISMMTDGDPASAATFRSPLELVHDNTGYLEDQIRVRAAAQDSSDLARDALVLHTTSPAGLWTDTTQFMGAAEWFRTGLTTSVPYYNLVAKSGASDSKNFSPDDCRTVSPGATIASITSAVRELASSGTRIVAIGTGGNLNAFTTTAAASGWTAGGAGIGNSVQYLVWSPPNALSGGGAKFYTGGSTGAAVYSSPDSATIWVARSSVFAAVLGLAVLGGATANAGYVVALGASGGKPRFCLLTDGGAGADFSGTQQPPSASTADAAGSLCGAPLTDVGDAVYHAMTCDSGARIRLSLSTDGFTWVASSTTIEAPLGVVFATTPRLLICKVTGLMVLLCVDNSTGAVVAYASRDFQTWAGPRIINGVVGGVQLSAFAVAAGRLIFTDGADLFMSDGIGI